MKKRFFALILGITVLISAFSGGCSCSGETTLSFDAKMMPADFERLVYTVKYAEDYLGRAKKTDEFNNLVTFRFGDENGKGSFSTEITKANGSEIQSDILDLKSPTGDSLVTDIYKITADFAIDIKTTIKGAEYNHTERITTKAYIAGTGASLAPLYSEEHTEYMLISVNADDAQAVILKSETKTFYDKSSLRVEKKSKYFAPDAAAEEITLENETAEVTEKNYSFRSLIDNAELLFALRGIAPEEKSSQNVPVTSPVYPANPQTMRITHGDSASGDFTVRYNGGETIAENFTYNIFDYRLANDNAAGKSQYYKIQSKKSENVENYALMLEYATPLTFYGSWANMGWLVFTISEITRT